MYVTALKLDDREHAALDRFSEQHRISKAGALRLAFRLMTGLPVPSWAMAEYEAALAKRQDRQVAPTPR